MEQLVDPSGHTRDRLGWLVEVVGYRHMADHARDTMHRDRDTANQIKRVGCYGSGCDCGGHSTNCISATKSIFYASDFPFSYKSKHYITDLEFLFFLFEDWRPLLRHYCLFLKTCVTLIWVEVSNRIY